MDAWSIVSQFVLLVKDLLFISFFDLFNSQNMGQNCIGIERLLVHSEQYDDLYAIFKERVSKLRVGSVMSPQQAGFMAIVDGGAMISHERFRGIETLINDAVDGNAYLVGGAEFKNHPYHPDGYFFQPTVVGPVDESMEIAQKECRSFPFVWMMTSFNGWVL